MTDNASVDTGGQPALTGPTLALHPGPTGKGHPLLTLHLTDRAAGPGRLLDAL